MFQKFFIAPIDIKSGDKIEIDLKEEIISTIERNGEVVYIQGSDDDVKFSIERQIKEYLNKHVNVYISYSDELYGQWRWAIIVKDSNDFWLESFEREDEAIDYCNKYGLKIVE